MTTTRAPPPSVRSQNLPHSDISNLKFEFVNAFPIPHNSSPTRKPSPQTPPLDFAHKRASMLRYAPVGNTAEHPR